MVANFEVRH